MRTLRTLGLTLFLSLNAAQGFSETWTEWDDVKPDQAEFIYARDKGIVFDLKTTTRSAGPANCNRKFILPTASLNYHSKAEALLAAFFSTKAYTVRISFDKDSTECYAPVQWVAIEYKK